VDPTELADLCERVARDAGALLLEHASRAPAGVATKSSLTDMVSEADVAAQALIVDAIAAARPADAILGEEGADRRGTSGLRWVVDPLDGTTNFLYRYPQWAVSIAVEDDEGPVAGCVYDPSRLESFVAARGHGATVDGRTIVASPLDDLDRALVGTGFGYDAERRRRQAEQLAGVLPHVRDIRRGGSAALDLAWTACGRLDAYFESGLQHWDWAAGLLVVREAGGRCEVGPGPLDTEQIVAAGPALYPRLTALLG
jgi:myo-inositol-1(or 4)-monophosphatase